MSRNLSFTNHTQSPFMKQTKYDIIGDIHGYASELKQLLTRLGYEETDGCFRHPSRKVIFLGDFIDRGPEIREVLRVVRAMVDNGAALAVMGNHEYNAIIYHTPDGQGGHLRSHTEKDSKNTKIHQATLDQIAEPLPGEWADHLAWFKSLPMFLEINGARIVHACWDNDHIATLDGDNRLTDDLLLKSVVKGSREYKALDVLLKGREVRLPEGEKFTDKNGVVRKDMRVKWWLNPDGLTFHELSMPESETVPKTAIPAEITRDLGRGYEPTEPMVFVGHYWLPPQTPRPLAQNVACLDYSVAKDGMLVAYRWDGEKTLDETKFVQVNRQT